MPTTTAVGPAELVDRIGRGDASHVVGNVDDVAKYAEVPGDDVRIAVGSAQGWADLHEAYQRDGTASGAWRDSQFPELRGGR